VTRALCAGGHDSTSCPDAGAPCGRMLAPHCPSQRPSTASSTRARPEVTPVRPGSAVARPVVEPGVEEGSPRLSAAPSPRPVASRPQTSHPCSRPSSDPGRVRQIVMENNARYNEIAALGVFGESTRRHWRCGKLPASARLSSGRRHEPLAGSTTLRGCGLSSRRAVGIAERLSAAYAPASGKAAEPKQQRRPASSRASSAPRSRGFYTGHNGAPNMTHASERPPLELMADACYALEAHSTALDLRSPFVARCERQGLVFEVEVASIDSTQTRFVVRFQHIAGDDWQFKQLCNRLLPSVRISA